MKNKTLQQWLDEMDKLDREATNVEEWETDLASDSQRMIAYALGPKSFFRNSFDREPIYQSQKDEEFIKKSRTELPRAVKIIKTILDRFIDFELEAAVQEEIEKILNE